MAAPGNVLLPARATRLSKDSVVDDDGAGTMRSIMQGPVDQQSVAVSWRSRGFCCDLWVDPPGQVWADYLHEVDELMMVAIR